MKSAIIVGASPLGGEKEELKKQIQTGDYYTIAADGGIRFFIENNICPDIYIGDMDSSDSKMNIREIFPDINVESCSPIKDVTDMEIAVSNAVSKNYSDIIIYGGIGGNRISHMFANIQLMSAYKSKGINITMFGDNSLIYLLSSGDSVLYSSDKKGFISVISLTDISKNVEIKGFFYEYKGDLYNTNALGVSNEFTGREGQITIGEGMLLIIEENLV